MATRVARRGELALLGVPALDVMIAPYRDRTWQMTPGAARVFRQLPAPLPVRFLPPAPLVALLADRFGEELRSLRWIHERVWVAPAITPIAAVAMTAADQDDAGFLASAIGFLFHDGDHHAIRITAPACWQAPVLIGGIDSLRLRPPRA